jgi:hypothetical protein
VDRRFFIQTMMGGLAAAGLSLDELPEWFLDPPRGRSQVIVPREVRLVLPKRDFIGTDFGGVRYVYETSGILVREGKNKFVEREIVRWDKGLRQEKIDGVWRVKRD